MSSNTLITNPLYQQPSSSAVRSSSETLSTPLAVSNVSSSKRNISASSIQPVLGVISYAGGLFALAWWQLAHPSFGFLLLGAVLIILGAKLFIFPKKRQAANDHYMAHYSGLPPETLEPNIIFSSSQTRSNRKKNKVDFLLPL
jgi:hypothetical protein